MPMESRYLEDYVPGSVEETRSVVVTPEELRSFAQRYDPQPIHIDEAAETSSPPFGYLSLHLTLTLRQAQGEAHVPSEPVEDIVSDRASTSSAGTRASTSSA